MPGPVRIAVAGGSGRMGRMLVQAIFANDQFQLTGVLDQPDSPALGLDAAAFVGTSSGANNSTNSSVHITSDVRAGLQGAQVLIDFTRPEATLAHLAVCAELGVRAVVGTTGFSAQQKETLTAHAQRQALVVAPNMSVGVNVMLQLLARAAQALGPDYDIEVLEAHHRHKVDAPSGTALAMGEVLAQARGLDLARDGVFARQGHTGERNPQAIGFATLRGGDIVGEHTVLFCGAGERIEISHKSSSRANYAEGSLRAARFLAALPAGATGLYGMNDVLGLK
jgi:4-hydroxy-tetrahydrodipicolinate reductase